MENKEHEKNCGTDLASAPENIGTKIKDYYFHDPLTALYNRTFFEAEMHRLENEINKAASVGLIICDIDGLKSVNDKWGFDKGNEFLVNSAQLIKKSFKENVVIARIGSDEFAIILPMSSPVTVEAACRRIRFSFDNHNIGHPDFPINMSVGFAVSNGTSFNSTELFREADNNLHREKLYHPKSSRSAIVNTLMKTLKARDVLTERHGSRVQKVLVHLAKSIKLPKSNLTDLLLLAQFHDIGKVGIPDFILFKPGPLTLRERLEMQKHCEIGYRIAQSSPDLIPIGDLILKHHEWWNGGGYPLALQGKDIPIECRILSIMDAYDAIISDRPYRDARSHEEALEEIKRFAGTQFDPDLVDNLLRVLN